MSSIIRHIRETRDSVVVSETTTGRVVTEATLAAEARLDMEANATIADARKEADALLRRSREEAAAVRMDAYDEGFRHGVADAAATFAERFAEAEAILLAAGRDSQALRECVLRNAEREVIEMVLDVARKVIGDAVRIDPSLIVDQTERALARAGNQNILRIRVHPEQYEIVAASFEGRYDADGNAVTTVADTKIDLGGCVIDLKSGVIDARLDTQIDELGRILRDFLGDDNADPV